MADKIFIKMNREVLYNEIWEISAAGTARKYNIPYSELLRICKEKQIPTPPSLAFILCLAATTPKY